jgi:formate dehydrogenase subunit gamma
MEGGTPLILRIALALMLALGWLALAPAGGGVTTVPAWAQALDQPPNARDWKRSPAEMWHDLRKGLRAPTSQPFAKPRPAIQSQGQDWRVYRNRYIRPYGGWLVLAAAIFVGLLLVLRVRVRLRRRTGRLIPRISLYRRLAHWFMATSFILLALSGIVMLFGRLFLPQVLGPYGFAALASAAKEMHNLFGPLFIVSLVMFVPAFVCDNMPSRDDAGWLLRLGGLLGHAPAGKFNAGEKIWFWTLAIGGLALALSGIYLDFPFLADTVQTLQTFHLMHAIAAVIVIAFALGHIYMATAYEGTLDAMVSGCVDEGWAKQHHELWLQEVLGRKGKEAGACPPGTDEKTATAAALATEKGGAA